MDTGSPVASHSSTPPAAPPLLLSVPEVAQTLGVSARFVRLLVARNQISSVRLGRRCLIRRADIEDLVVRGGFLGTVGVRP
jgi:excisionase family DNA binding protein